MKTYYCWYDNGTGWYEGPYPVEAESEMDALKKENLMWAFNSYGAVDRTGVRLYTIAGGPFLSTGERNGI